MQGGWLATDSRPNAPLPSPSLPSPPQSLLCRLSFSSAAAIFSSSGASAAQLDRFALIVPDELLHFLANVSQSAIGKERNEGKSLPPWRCHFHTLGLAACQQTGRSEEVDWSPGLRERSATIRDTRAASGRPRAHRTRDHLSAPRRKQCGVPDDSSPSEHPQHLQPCRLTQRKTSPLLSVQSVAE